MDVSVEWRDGKYPSFKTILRSKPGADPFLEIKNCRIVQGGRNGEFVSFPAEKGKDGKWYAHVYAGEAFAAHVLTLAKAALPKTARGTTKAADDADEIPF